MASAKSARKHSTRSTRKIGMKDTGPITLHLNLPPRFMETVMGTGDGQPQGIHSKAKTEGGRTMAPRFDLIPSEPLRRLAARYQLGAEKYGVGAWETGLSFENTLDHTIDHLLQARDRRRRFDLGERPDPRLQDDDLSAAAWGCFTLMAYQESEKK
jgi:hypothetical protein